MSKFTEIKLKKTCRYILYKIENSKKIVIDEIGDRSMTFVYFTRLFQSALLTTLKTNWKVWMVMLVMLYLILSLTILLLI